MLRELELLPDMFQTMERTLLQNAPKLLPAKPGAISEHFGAMLISLFGTFLGATPIPVSICGVFVKVFSSKLFTFTVWSKSAREPPRQCNTLNIANQ